MENDPFPRRTPGCVGAGSKLARHRPVEPIFMTPPWDRETRIREAERLTKRRVPVHGQRNEVGRRTRYEVMKSWGRFAFARFARPMPFSTREAVRSAVPHDLTDPPRAKPLARTRRHDFMKQNHAHRESRIRVNGSRCPLFVETVRSRAADLAKRRRTWKPRPDSAANPREMVCPRAERNSFERFAEISFTGISCRARERGSSFGGVAPHEKKRSLHPDARGTAARPLRGQRHTKTPMPHRVN